tara:strand:+ start:926 stop:1603 length:678 start_codon:yes stop_codon:yes gene_type:complete
MNVKKKTIIKFVGLFLIIIAVILTVKFTGLSSKLNIDSVKILIENSGIYGPLIFIGVYFLSTILFIPATPLTVSSGILFGSFVGTAYVVIGATLGSMIAFLFARYFGKGFVGNIVEKKFHKLKEYDEKIEQNGFMVMLVLRLLPIFPFNGLNFAMGMTRIKFKDYVLATFIGIIPGSFVFANLGGNILNIKSPQFLLSVGMLLTLMAMPLVYRKFKNNSKANKEQ